MAGGIHNIDPHTIVHDSRIFGKNGDPAFPFQIVAIHDPVDYGFVYPEYTALPQQLVHQCGFPMVNVSNNSHIAQIISYVHVHHSILIRKFHETNGIIIALLLSFVKVKGRR